MSVIVIRDTEASADNLGPLTECMEHYDVGSRKHEWPNNILSRRAVAYPSGVIGRQGSIGEHSVDSEELDLCQQLAAEAAGLMQGIQVGMGSAQTSGFAPFFIAASAGSTPPGGMDQALVEQLFAGTLFPGISITVEPLQCSGSWWDTLQADFEDEDEDEDEDEEETEDGEDDDDEEWEEEDDDDDEEWEEEDDDDDEWVSDEDEDDDEDGDDDEDDDVDDMEEADQETCVAAWERLASWFGDHEALSHAVFVQIGDDSLDEMEEEDYPPGTEMTGCVFPRLALALTERGSVVGIAGVCVLG